MRGGTACARPCPLRLPRSSEEGEPAMSKPTGRREAHGEKRGMSRRALLRIGVTAAITPPAVLRARRAAAQIGGGQPAASTPTGELKNPAELKAPKVKASSPTMLSFWQ